MIDRASTTAAAIFDVVRVYGTGTEARARVRAILQDAFWDVQQETLHENEIRPPDEEPPASAGT
jgi:hypothetical protein